MKRQGVKWKIPPEGWHKDNFDRVANGNPSPIGCGGIIKNSHGVGIAPLSHPLGNQKNHYAEASATLYTAKMALEVGFKHLWLEGDSNNIIICINGDL